MVTVIDADAMSPHGISWSPGKSAMATGIVLDAIVEVKVSANRNSFHENINTRIAVVIMPGKDKGNIIL